jgi:tRNA pseudouridine synthase 9
MLGKRKKEEVDSPSSAESLYYFKNGLRFVKEYSHSFSCHAKRRWIGQKLIKIYSEEFKAFSETYYANSMNHEGKGKITVNKEKVDIDYCIKDGDYILHETIREETPVCNDKITIIKETDDYLIVNKPSSMPVHACGNFKFNTL